MFPELALTLLLFTHRLDRELRARQASHALFLAREGRILMELFEIYQSSVHRAERPVETDYVYVSRRALYTASVPHGSYGFEGLRQRYRDLDVEDLLRSLGFAADDVDRLRRGAGSVDELIASGAFRSAFDAHRAEQHELARTYLRPFLEKARDRIHVVDVGWKGSMQDFLADLFGAERPIHGWYLGLGPNVLRQRPDGSTKRGLLFEAGPPSSRYFTVFAHFKSLYESLLNAGHGSVAGYRRTETGAEPVLDELTEETEQHTSLIEPIQRQLVELFGELCEAFDPDDLELVSFERFVATKHTRAIFRPRPQEVDVVRSMQHYENFGPMALRSRGTSRPDRTSERQTPLLPAIAPANGWPALRAVEGGRAWTVRPAGLLRTARTLTREAVRATAAPLDEPSS